MTLFALPAAGNSAEEDTASFGNEERSALLAEVDFKWLMAGEGQWVDMARFQQDFAYAARILHFAQASPCAALRDCARLLAASHAKVMLKADPTAR